MSQQLTAADSELQALRARVADLETENQQLLKKSAQVTGDGAGKTGSGAGKAARRGLSALSAILIVLSVVFAPVALLNTWARSQLVDTERFTATFAPLADNPHVQSFITDKVMEGVEANVDIDGMVKDVFTGVADLGLPEQTKVIIPLLSGPAADGIRSMLRTGVTEVIRSDQFTQIFEATLTQSHKQAIALIQSDPNAMLQLQEDGTLAISLNEVIAEVKTVLIDQGFSFASAIPAVDQSIPLFSADSLVTIRTLYNITVIGGNWFPWVILIGLLAGVVLARHRMRALAWAGVGLAISFLTLAAGIGIGREVFIATLAPSVMPATTAQAVFTQVTTFISSTTMALVMLSVIIAVGAWFASGAKFARKLRSLLDAGFSGIRKSMDRHGLHTRGFGLFVNQWHTALYIVAVLVATVAVFMDRPVRGSSIWTAVILLVVFLVVLEVVKRDSADPAPADALEPDAVPAAAESEAPAAAEALADTKELSADLNTADLTETTELTP